MTASERQGMLAIWQIQQLIDGLVLSGVPQENINEAMKYASNKTLKDFYAEVDPFNNGGTAQ